MRNEKDKEARGIPTQAIRLKSQTRTRDVAEKLDSGFRGFVGFANMKAGEDSSNDFIKVVTGQRTPRIYKNRSKYGLLPFKGRDIKIHEDDKFYICLPKGFRFEVNLGSRPGKARDVASVLRHIMGGDYKLNQSNLILDGGKLFFNRIRQKSLIPYRWVMNAAQYEDYRW